MDVRGEHIEPDPAAQSVGRAVFGKGLDEYQQGADGVVAGEQGREDFPQPQSEARAEYRAAFLQTGGNVHHGVFQHGHREGEHVQAHHQHQPAKAEEALGPGAGGGEELLKQSPFLHEHNPAHRGNIRRRHERHHEDNVQPAVLRQLGAGQHRRGGDGDDGGARHHADPQEQGIADRLYIFRVRDGSPHLIQVKAAICDDRLGEYCNQGTENQTCQKRQKQRGKKSLFPADWSHNPSRPHLQRLLSLAAVSEAASIILSQSVGS